MWVFAKGIGFISIVQYDEPAENLTGGEQPDLLVRARCREHLERAFPEHAKQIVDAAEVGGNYDYAWRVKVPRGEVIELMTEALLDLDYTSHVKEEVSDHDTQLYRSMMDCWQAMMRYQQLEGSREEDMWGSDAAD